MEAVTAVCRGERVQIWVGHGGGHSVASHLWLMDASHFFGGVLKPENEGHFAPVPSLVKWCRIACFLGWR